jgi:cytochrome c
VGTGKVLDRLNSKVKTMTHQIFRARLTATVASAALFLLTSSAYAVDEDAAKALFKKNDCTKCHAPAKDKKGPSLKKIAKENAGKADAEAKMLKHMTTGPKVKLEDGTEEEHKIIDTKDQAEMKNLIQWILAQ